MKALRMVILTLLAAALLSPAAARAQESAAARLQRLEDIEEIRTVLIDYGRYLDAHDLVSYANLFAADGEWVGGFGTGKGPAGVLALMQKNLGATSTNRAGSTYHLLTNFLIDVHGDTATAWSRWNFVTAGSDNSPKIMYGGHYDDTLVREGGQWKFKRRIAVNDIPAGNSAPPSATK
ncbi:MAG: nuclear transport factor 2 family protein [Candidatus Acidiferrales bacterium]